VRRHTSRNAPRSIETFAAVRVGSSELALAAHGVTRTAANVSIERGALREVWRLTPDAAEQTFVLAHRPAASGSLRLHIALESELTIQSAEHGLELVGERGSVAISDVFVVDAAGVRTQVECTLADKGFSIEVPAAVLASARYPLVVDPVYSTHALDTTTAFMAHPDITNSTTSGSWAVVYEFAYSSTDNDLYTQDLVGGVPQTGVWVDTTTASWNEPHIACNALFGTYLTVADVRPTGSSLGQVWCRARVVGGTFQYAQKLVQNSSLGSCRSTDVGGDPALVSPTYFLAIWTRQATNTDWDVHGRLIDGDGTLIGTTPIFIENTTAFDLLPSISKTDGTPPFATQEWNLTWQRIVGSQTDIWGAQIHWDGLMTTPPFLIASSGQNDQFPSASSLLDGASGPRPWMVTYDRYVGSDYDIIAKALVGSTPITPELNVSVMEGADIYENQLHPNVDSNGQRFALAYCESYNNAPADYDLYVATLHIEGNVLVIDEAHQLMDASSLNTDDAPIACCIADSSHGNPYYGLAWSTHFGGTSDVYTGVYSEPSSYQSFCFGDGSWGNCPCSNSGAAGKGCANSTTNGGTLTGSGSNFVSGDTFALSASNIPGGPVCLYFQGSIAGTGGVAFGDGLLCANGGVLRIGFGTLSGGSAIYPAFGDAPISVKGGIPPAGGTRAYQVWYRDNNSFCTAATFNLTSAVGVLWLR
ncbi:MAG: hypothetical protein SGI72_13060, partial [Planctomycetota bacterium]|nr:hypothetical protein [Planctomycetota bacterium]